MEKEPPVVDDDDVSSSEEDSDDSNDSDDLDDSDDSDDSDYPGSSSSSGGADAKDEKKEESDSVFRRAKPPAQRDLKLEFGDGETFLVDGDAAIFSILRKMELSHSGNTVSSIHVIYLLEKALKQFIDRGGRPQVVFFGQMEGMWSPWSPLALLRKVVLRHLRENTSVRVLTDFRSLLDPDFLQFVVDESVLMICLTDAEVPLGDLSPKSDSKRMRDVFNLHIELALKLGLNVSFLDDAVVSVSTICSFHLYTDKGGGGVGSKADKRYKNLMKQFAAVAEDPTAVAVDPYRFVCSKMMGLEKENEVPKKVLRYFTDVFMLSVGVKRTGKLSSLFLPGVTLECKPDSVLSHLNERLAKFLCRVVSLVPPKDLPTLSDPAWLFGLIYCQSADPAEFTRVTRDLEVNFKASKTLFGCLRVSKEPITEPVQVKLCTLDNGLFDQYLAGLEKSDFYFPESAQELYRVFEEKYHWHVMRPISDELHRLAESTTRGATSYANYMSKYGSSIEGDVKNAQSAIVPVESTTGDVKKKGKKGNNKVSNAGLAIINKNVVCQAEKRLKALDSSMRTLTSQMSELQSVMKSLGGITGAPEADKLLAQCEKKLLLLRLEETENIFKKQLKRSEVDINLEVSFLCEVRKVVTSVDLVKYKDQPELKKMQSRLLTLGYSKFVEETFGNIAAAETKNESKSLVRFQLEHMGHHLELDRPAKGDPRIDTFIPDEWQRRLFDAIDARQSALIIAPTSSGKTYASYYCMEQVLRESDSAVVVYVAPTKALVNQVAATVYARFSKRKNRTHAVYGVFTKDYRFNTSHCQILVTVPACLEILLLSPNRASWCDRLRYVIFDEVHNIGAEGDASAWEHTLLMVRCPFLALSATVANPEDLHRWLTSIEKRKEEQDKASSFVRSSYEVQLVEYGDRHADLIKYAFRPQGGKKNGEELTTVHPLSLIKVSDVVETKMIPRHITMSANESLQLFTALSEVEPAEELEPSNFFSEKFISRNEVLKYGLTLLKKLETLSGERLNLVVRKLPGFKELHEYKPKNKKTFLNLVSHLKTKHMLPALVFVFDRRSCNELPLLVISDIDKQLNGLVEEKEENVLSKRERKKFNNLAEEVKHGKKNKKREDNPKEKTPSAMEFFTKHCSGDNVGTVTFVQKHNLGEQTADFLLQRLMMEMELKSDFAHALQLGISWHHAGNGNVMRMTTEMLFRSGFLNLVVATTTLAQGIHMPCKTVVFYSDSLFLNTLSYHQCSGRAGRRGFDMQGNVVFFNVPRSKVSRLVTSPLPKILGNEPISLSVILSALIYTANVKIEGRDVAEVKEQAVQRVLCLLKGSLILQTRPEMESQLKHFFRFAIDYLAQQGYLNKFGEPIGFSGLASHLRYLEPYNFAFCHLLREGYLHKMCKKDSHGNFNAATMQKLLLVVATLFYRKKLHKGFYEKRKKLFHNSKVLMEGLPEKVKKGLDRFNDDLKKTFSDFLRFMADRTEAENCLPLSKLQYEVQQNNIIAGRVNSVFVSGKKTSNASFNGLFDDTNGNLFTSFMPVVDTDCDLNRYVLDFFNHGIPKDLIKDNGLLEGEVFNSLRDMNLVIMAIATSLKEIGPDLKRASMDQETDRDNVVEAFQQLSKEFDKKFAAKCNDRRFKRRGCVKIHQTDCQVCDLMIEGRETMSKWGAPFVTRGYEMCCETPRVIYSLKCSRCGKLFVFDSVRPMKEKIMSFVDPNGLGEERVRKCFRDQHDLAIQILETFSADEKDLVEKKAKWESKLRADQIRGDPICP